MDPRRRKQWGWILLVFFALFFAFVGAVIISVWREEGTWSSLWGDELDCIERPTCPPFEADPVRLVKT